MENNQEFDGNFHGNFHSVDPDSLKKIPVDEILSGGGVEREEGDLKVWESLAICEYVAERFANDLWPADVAERAIARSICAEMHAGFSNLRENMPMDCRNRYPGEGMTPGVEAEIDRIFAIWRECRQQFGTGGNMLFGKFTVVDAMFAPVVMRFVTYGVKLDSVAKAYADAILALPAIQEWVAAACSETESIPHIKK